MATLNPHDIQVYHVFISSPDDMDQERQAVRRFFDKYNRQTAAQWNVRFDVIDKENSVSSGVGQPQQLITAQTLEKYKASLALVVGLMGQRFGSEGEVAGTEQEFEWAYQSNKQSDFPEIKWFFKKIEQFTAPSDPELIVSALDQWKKVRAFRNRLTTETPLLFKEFSNTENLQEVLSDDLSAWLAAPERDWIVKRENSVVLPVISADLPEIYYENIVRDFQWLDIAGIDNERSFNIPLSEMYVRLRVMLDEDAPIDDTEDASNNGSFDIHTALRRYSNLIIVGDPGSGKSTFLKFIALIIARSVLDENPGLALERLSLPSPLQVPIFISCWDLAEFVAVRKQATLPMLVDFILDRMNSMDGGISREKIEHLLENGLCCLLLDGLDEVSTDSGRTQISRLIETCVSRYSRNRYVITSRIRAYTGGTILRGALTRCDIQPFNQEDRFQFLQNWFALLLKKQREEITAVGSEGRMHLDTLLEAIERKDRIRILAVNPLLLTVIAIVHWNRKRLPEQRVELYDECVDVLLGQRKEAEKAHTSKTAMMDAAKEEQILYDRTWVRKRFAEIAYNILLEDKEEEITKRRVLDVLRPRFIDKGGEK